MCLALSLGALLAAATRAGPLITNTDGMQPQVAALIDTAVAVVRADRQNAAAWGHLGQVLHVHGLLAGAVDSYARAMRLAPTAYRWVYLAALATPPDAPDEALALFARAYELAPHDYALGIAYGDMLTRMGLIDRAQPVYRQARRLDADRGYADLGLGRLALMAGDLAEARARLLAARGDAPQNGEIHRLLAQVLHRLGDTEGAQDAAWRAEAHTGRLQPTSTVVDQMRSLGVNALGDPIRKLAPANVPNLVELAALQRESGNPLDATDTLRHSLELAPGHPRATFDLAMLLATTAAPGSEDAAQAQNLALRLYRLNRHSARHAHLLSIAYAANERYELATRVAERALQLADADSDLAATIKRHLARIRDRTPSG